jgi:hypothetical protein
MCAHEKSSELLSVFLCFIYFDVGELISDLSNTAQFRSNHTLITDTSHAYLYTEHIFRLTHMHFANYLSWRKSFGQEAVQKN